MTTEEDIDRARDEGRAEGAWEANVKNRLDSHEKDINAIKRNIGFAAAIAMGIAGLIGREYARIKGLF